MVSGFLRLRLKGGPENSKETKRIHNSSGLEKEDRMSKERQIQENGETGRIPDAFDYLIGILEFF